MQWLGSKINGRFPLIFFVLCFGPVLEHLDWFDVCVEEMADLQLQQHMPDSGASCFP